MKAERPNFRSLPIRSLDFLHLSTDGHSVNRPKCEQEQVFGCRCVHLVERSDSSCVSWRIVEGVAWL